MFRFGDAMGGRVWKLPRNESHIPTRSTGFQSTLQQSHHFGSNPGDLVMFSYIPSSLPDNPALVVVLHGCGQTAAGYEHGAGWSTLADRYGFALLVPEQQRSNNPNGCFNWFQPDDTQRGRGEAASICQMVETMVCDHGIDPRRVFITGLSAGGAMTSVMLACYPDVFAGGAIVAGLPYGAATNVQQAFQSMSQCPSRPAKDWGDLVRAAAGPRSRPWPRISVWHGSADRTVIPSNAHETLKQWTEVHGLPMQPSKEVTIDSYPRQVWTNDVGEELIESYTIARMAHGTPLATGRGDSECGAAGPFLLDIGISSSYHIAKFFGLTATGVRSPSRESLPAAQAKPMMQRESPRDAADDVKKLPPRFDVGAVITKALTAAGLMKR